MQGTKFDKKQPNKIGWSICHIWMKPHVWQVCDVFDGLMFIFTNVGHCCNSWDPNDWNVSSS